MENSQRWVLVIVASFLAVGVGCGVWLGFFHDWHEGNRQAAQEDRHAEIVGAKPLPKEPMKVVIKNGRGGCHVIDRAEWDAEDLWVYYHDECRDSVPATTISWQGISPDGTVVISGWEFTHFQLEIGQKAEYHARISIDPRVVTIQVRALWNDTSYREY